jgi:hypothetical protein
VGTVEVAGKKFTVQELGYAEELRLGVLLRKLHAEEHGNAWKRTRAMIEEIPRHMQGPSVAECVRIEAAGELPGLDALNEARTSPKGVALELWMRARKNHKGLALEECQAIITDVNCLDVLQDMLDALTPTEVGDDSKS